MSQPEITRRSFLILAGTTSFSAFLAACAQAATPVPTAAPTAVPSAMPASPTALAVPKRGGVLRIIPPDTLTQFDPATQNTTMEIHASFTAWDNLVVALPTEKGKQQLTPRLGESWEISEDGKSLTFKLRQGVTFHHGTPFTAKDVEYTMQRVLDPKIGSSFATNLKALDKLEVVDDYTIRFLLKEPDFVFIYALALPGCVIVPHDRTTEQLTKEPSGTGPFKLAQYTAGERVVYKRNEQYWDKERPYVDEVQYLFISQPAAQLAALTSGDADIIDVVGLETLPQIEQTPGIKAVINLEGLYHLFAMRATEKPFNDVRVRQAFKHAIDRGALQKAVTLGRGTIGNDQPIDPDNVFWANVPPLAYDPAKAKELLAAAGYPNGLEVTLNISEFTPRVVDAAIAIQEMVKASGITLTLNKVPVNTYWSQQYMQTPFFASFWPTFPEPNTVLSLAYFSTSGFNEGGWRDPKLDELIIKGRQESDKAKRQTIYTEIQKLISEQGAVLIPYFLPHYSGARANINGPISFGAGIHPQYIWLG